MMQKYEEFNLRAKEYFLSEFDKKFYKKYDSKELYDRCFKEMNILFNKGVLFIIEHLYKFKKVNKHVSYHFKGSINNLLFLYVLGLTHVDVIKYRLPYELFTDKTIRVDLIGEEAISFVRYLDKLSDDFKIVSGSYEKESIEEINKLVENHYLLVPTSSCPDDIMFRFNEWGILETVNDYRNYELLFLVIGIGEKYLIDDYDKIGVHNVLENELEKEISSIMKPKTLDDYVKIKSIVRGLHAWKCNQEELVKNGKVDFSNLIANKEDVYEYLTSHNIDSSVALEIIKFCRCSHSKMYHKIWARYVSIMRECECDDMFIDILRDIDFLVGRGEAISECLFANDKKNYV